MEYVFAFRSRTNAIQFFEALKNEGIYSSLINTPKFIGIGCGLSVRLSNYAAAKRVLSLGFSNFHAIYKIDSSSGFVKFIKIN